MANPQGPFYVELGRRLAEARRDRKVTQAAIAAACALSRASVVNIERGRQPLSVEALVRWCTAVNVPVLTVLPSEQPAAPRDVAEGLKNLPPAARNWAERVAALSPELAGGAE